MARTPTAPVDLVFEKEEPPESASKGTQDLLDQIAKVRAENDGEWYKIAVFHNTTGASGRKSILSKRKDCGDVEFRAAKLGAEQSALYVKVEPVDEDDETRAERIEANRRARRGESGRSSVARKPI